MLSVLIACQIVASKLHIIRLKMVRAYWERTIGYLLISLLVVLIKNIFPIDL